MNSLTVFDYGQQGIRFEQRGDRVWVSLTDMAKASGKKVNDWSRLNSTAEFLTKLEAVAGNPVTETIQGGQPQLQGTWAIEEVAIKFAAWCSIPFEIWIMQQIKTLMSEGTVSLGNQPQIESGLQKVLKDGESLLKFNNLFMQPIGVDQAIINAIAIEQVQEAYPEYAKILQPTRNALNNAIVSDTPLTPTQIGEQIGLSAIKVNQLLIEKGLQTKNKNKKSRKEPPYLPTTKGSEWAVQTTSKGKGKDNSTYYQLRWYPSVVNALQ